MHIARGTPTVSRGTTSDTALFPEELPVILFTEALYPEERVTKGTNSSEAVSILYTRGIFQRYIPEGYVYLDIKHCL